MKIIGIDPGTATTGFAIIEKKNGKLRAIDFGVISTPAGLPAGQRLAELGADLAAILAQHRPDAAVIEKLFFTKNITTALPVAEARGIALFELWKAGLVPVELSPPQVKKAVTGSGTAGKKQVQEMVQRIFDLAELPKPDDAADALALAFAAS